jgi:hypothetical protein
MKDVPGYYHRLAKLNLLIIGAMTTSNGSKCFVCVEETNSRERLFPIEGFDAPLHELEDTWTRLQKIEIKRVKAQRVKERARTRREQDRVRQQHDDYEARSDDEERTPWSYEPTQPLEESADDEPAETETISRSDSEGHTSYDEQVEAVLTMEMEAAAEVETEEDY